MSKMIESFLKSVTKREKPARPAGGKETEITPLVKSLSGFISVEDDFDVENAYGQYSMKKKIRLTHLFNSTF